jgi:hypothetical protein
MNKRIKELADQARAKQTEEFYSRIGWTTQEWCSFYDEKFAELVIKECDRYVAEHYDECEPWMNPGDLLKHFGVEE